MLTVVPIVYKRNTKQCSDYYETHLKLVTWVCVWGIASLAIAVFVCFVGRIKLFLRMCSIWKVDQVTYATAIFSTPRTMSTTTK